jgi:aspartyl-tRNA(Asn)/glutamyl-tRNA(Gln) amidotransferase subunit A
MNAEVLCDRDLRTVGEAIATREVTSTEVTEAYLERIARHDTVLRAYITVMADAALARAKAADDELARGVRRGPLHGVPVALKDLVACAGVRMTAGSQLLARHVPSHDAFVTERLQVAGAVILGKLSLHEFAFGRPANDGPFPTGRNPWNIRRTPGGSSSGSAVAVAAGLCAGALGSDTGGSIRGPASLCGIVGLKPTYGLVSRQGVVPMCWTLDHVGPMTRTVWDAALLLQAIAGRDPGDPSTRDAQVRDYTMGLDVGVRGLKLGLLRRFYVDGPGLDADVRTASMAAVEELERQGAIVETIDVPALDLAIPIWGALIAEMYEYHAETLRARPGDYRDLLRPRILMGALVSAQDLLRAQRLRARLVRESLDALARVDALVFPGQAGPAPRFEDVPTRELAPASIRFTCPWNLTGLPALVVPCGFSRDGLPVSLQIVGRPYEEPTVLRIARAYERVTDWHQRRPDPTAWR